MIICSKCGTPFPEGVDICPNCGADRPLIHSKSIPLTSKSAERGILMVILSAVFLVPGAILTLIACGMAANVTVKYGPDFETYAAASVRFVHTLLTGAVLDGCGAFTALLAFIFGFSGVRKNVKQKNRALYAVIFGALLLLIAIVFALLAVNALLGDKGFL